MVDTNGTLQSKRFIPSNFTLLEMLCCSNCLSQIYSQIKLTFPHLHVPFHLQNYFVKKHLDCAQKYFEVDT